MSDFKLYNTLTREVSDFQPINPKEVKIYCCGPTVYDYQHIGNFKTFLMENLLVKALRMAGYPVKFVMNITDVGHLTSDADDGEDKMLIAAKREKKKSYEIAEFYTNKFFEDWDLLKMIRPDIVCKASDHIPEMITMIKTLEEKGYAYVANGNVYFDVSKLNDYGKLAKLDLEKLQAGTTIEVDSHKKGPFDFVLWFTNSKFTNPELTWESPWGEGYPGWHIECSAMSMKYLGEQIDIHCGGIDHVPVHHTNEIAQSEAATGNKWVNFWVHSEFILLNSEKMSKSKGGFITLDTLITDGVDPLAYKMLCLGTHYRKQINYSTESLNNASRNLQKIYSALANLPYELNEKLPEFANSTLNYWNDFRAAIFNDLNTPQALATFWQILDDQKLEAKEKLNLIFHCDEILGFDLKNWQPAKLEIPEEVLALVELRKVARANKDWSGSDNLRAQIAGYGFDLKDTGTEQTLTKKL